MSWVTAGDADAITKARRVVFDVEGHEVLVLAHDGEFYSFANRCIHKNRELAKGVVLNGKLVCPGHQWAFALGSGWEAVKEECQPAYPVRVTDGLVEVDVTVPQSDVPCADGDGGADVAVDVARSPQGSVAGEPA